MFVHHLLGLLDQTFHGLALLAFDRLAQAGEGAFQPLDLFFGDAYQDYDVIYDAVNFEMIAADVLGSGKLPGDECGSIVWPATWTFEPAAASVGVDRA